MPIILRNRADRGRSLVHIVALPPVAVEASRVGGARDTVLVHESWVEAHRHLHKRRTIGSDLAKSYCTNEPDLDELLVGHGIMAATGGRGGLGGLLTAVGVE